MSPDGETLPPDSPTHNDLPPARPALRYHGGKWRMAPWIIGFLPPHRCYVEPFGGAASVLLRKPRSYAEVYNDLDRDVVNLFRVLQDPLGSADLHRRLFLTPFARDEFTDAYEPTSDAVERARRLVIRSFMGFGSDGTRTNIRTGFRACSDRSGTTPAGDWLGYVDALPTLIDRMRGVVVENRDALACMAQHDGPATLYYVDPPYRLDTRNISHRNHGYTHEMTDADHDRLLDELRQMRGMVVLSAYPSPTYERALVGWRSIQRATYADGARPRTEVLWLSPRAADALATGDLFARPYRQAAASTSQA